MILRTLSQSPDFIEQLGTLEIFTESSYYTSVREEDGEKMTFKEEFFSFDV